MILPVVAAFEGFDGLGGLLQRVAGADGELEVPGGDPAEDLPQARGEDLGSGHDLGQVESDQRLAPFHQGGGHDAPRSPLAAVDEKTTTQPW